MYLTNATLEYFEKLTFKKKTTKKKATLNGHISKTTANSESKLRFSESSFNFFKAALFSVCSTHVGTQQGIQPPTSPDATASNLQGSKG